MSSYLTEAMVYERINRYQAEAAEPPVPLLVIEDRPKEIFPAEVGP